MIKIKKIFSVIALFMFMLPVSQVSAYTETFKTPHIKNDYCGKVMSVYNCKCAWHGQYCDTAGMDQSTATAFVTNAYNVWVEGLRNSFKSACEQNGGMYGSDTCNYCDAGTIRVGANCLSAEELCSDDPNIKYNENKKSCECASGYDLMSDKTCEPKCNPDNPFLFFNETTNECSCKSGYFLGDNDVCLGICGDDPNILYDEPNDDCYCPKGFDLEIEDEVYSCIELPDVDLKVEFEGSNPPLIADGQTKTKIHITLKEHDSETGVPARFELRPYSDQLGTGSITNIEEVSPGEYYFDYSVSDLTEVKGVSITGAYDALYIFYTSPTLGEEVYKTYQIDLTTGVPVKITKAGFKETISAVPFTSNSSTVKIYTILDNGEKAPIYDAEIAFSEFDYEKTAQDGTARMTAPKTVTGNENAEIEVIMELSDEVKSYQKRTKQQYEQIIVGEKGITNPTVKDFILNFNKYIAGASMEESENLIVGLRRTGYVLLHMTEGQSLAFDVAKEVASSIKNQISDTLDLFAVKDKVTEKLESKIDDQLKKLSTDQLDEAQEKALEKLKDLSPDLSKKMKKMNSEFESGVINMFKAGVKKYAPEFKDEWVDELFGQFFSNPLDDISVEKGVEKVQNIAQDAIEAKIKNYLVDEFDDMIQEGMSQLEIMIKNKSFNKTGFEADIFNAKWSALDLRGTYLKAHDVSYDISTIKDTADLFNNTVIETAKITGIWKSQAEALEKGYKAIRSGVLNNVEIFYWFSTYGEFSEEVKNNINLAIGAKVLTENHNNQQPFKLFGIQNVYAEEEISKDDISTYLDYKEVENGLDFYESMLEVNNLLLEIYPDDTEIKDLDSKINKNIDEQNNIKNSLEDKALEIERKLAEKKNADNETAKKAKNKLASGIDDQYDLDGDGKITLNDFTSEEWTVIGVFFIVIIGVIYGIAKLFKRKPKKLNPFEENLDDKGKENPFKGK